MLSAVTSITSLFRPLSLAPRRWRRRTTRSDVNSSYLSFRYAGGRRVESKVLGYRCFSIREVASGVKEIVLICALYLLTNVIVFILRFFTPGLSYGYGSCGRDPSLWLFAVCPVPHDDIR